MEERASRTRAPSGYADPGGQGLRWWDGTRWTEEVRPPAGKAASGRYPLRYALRDRWLVLLGAVVIVAAAVVAIILIRGRGRLRWRPGAGGQGHGRPVPGGGGAWRRARLPALR